MNKFFNHRAIGLALSLLVGGFGLPVLRAEAAPPVLEKSSGIDQAAFVPIGGIDQWIDIKGEDRGNPVLLVVHGGPGEAQWMAAEQYRPWQKAFTVVQWDQRGAGHSYGRTGAKTPDMTLDRIARDGIEVAEYLRRTLGKKKIIVLGHSWGSNVAIQMVKTRPDLFAAYVGTGQVASWKASVDLQFDFLLARARKDGDAATVKQLEAIGRPDPADAKQYFGFTKGLRAAMAPTDRAWIQSLRAKLPALQASDPQDLKDFADGSDFSGEHLLADEMAADLPATSSRIDTAFFVIQGADDIVTPTKAAADYFALVQAPQKKLIIIPGAGHFAFMTAANAFLAALIDDVRPVAIVRGA